MGRTPVEEKGMSETYADPQASEEPSNEPVETPGEQTQHGVPNPDTGVGIGADGEPNTFEPEEEPEATETPE
ncbi:MAG TPA: hypothetical protein VFJ97_11565 [Dermatophilaceae bacterium]|nr:hypothetical protein [Dermatophilaceae bacterium]